MNENKAQSPGALFFKLHNQVIVQTGNEEYYHAEDQRYFFCDSSIFGELQQNE